MNTHSICLYKDADIKYTGCNLKTAELLDCVLIGLCAVIRLNTVIQLTCGRLYKFCCDVLLTSGSNK